MEKQRGSAMLLAIFLLLVVGMLAMGVVGTATTDLKISDNYTRGIRNLYLADAGAAHVVALLQDSAGYGNLTPYPSGTPLLTGSINGGTYSIWIWNKRIAATGAITAFADPRTRQFRVLATDGRTSRRIEGVVSSTRGRPGALDRAVFACGGVTLSSMSDDITGPIYSGGTITYGANNAHVCNIETNGSYVGSRPHLGYIYANGPIVNASSTTSGQCRTTSTIAVPGNCLGGATSGMGSPPAHAYCNPASVQYDPGMFLDNQRLLDIYDQTPTGNRLTSNWNVNTDMTLNGTMMYVTGGDVTFGNMRVTYSGDSVIVVDGGSFTCNGCRIAAGTPSTSTITIITRNGDITVSGNAMWQSPNMVLWAGVLDAAGNLPTTGNISFGNSVDVDMIGSAISVGGVITSSRKFDIAINATKPPIFGGVSTRGISEWHELR